MNKQHYLLLFLIICFTSSCVSTKKYESLRSQLDNAVSSAEQNLSACQQEYSNYRMSSEQERNELVRKLRDSQGSSQLQEQRIQSLQEQVADLRSLRDKQLNQVEDLTTLSKSANDNIKETLSQLEQKDKYVQLLQTARSRADSVNLALAVNLKSALVDGIEDKDIEVKVDKTVVFINLSDKMLYQSGSANITPRAKEVLGKIATILETRSDLEVMVEGYTDDVPIKNSCMQDNWDLSVKRATAVVRVLQEQYKVDPNKLIAAGRGQYNTLASNETAAGRSLNRRTRVIIMPKLNQFYDLLNPSTAP